MVPDPVQLKEVLRRNLIFVHGKGGVGKTVVSHALALALSRTQTPKTLWITLEDPAYPLGQTRKISPSLSHLNCDFSAAFEEYASMKIGALPLTKLFLQNKLIRYLAKAAPGIHELVLLGKIWYEHPKVDHVVVDMPSTGYGLAMFQSTQNFLRLFHGGPLHKDARAMMTTFSDATKTGHLIVALPEEMPLRESLELDQFMMELFPDNPCAFLVNRIFPGNSTQLSPKYHSNPGEWPSPVAETQKEYIEKRALLETYNLRLWQERGIPFGSLPYVLPETSENSDTIKTQLAHQLKTKGYV